MPVKLSGSALPIAKECQWWLRGDVTYPAHESFLVTERETDLGSAVHMAADRGNSNTLDERIALACNKYHVEISEVREYMKHLDAKISTEIGALEAVSDTPISMYFEVSFAYDPVTGGARVLGCGLDREYEKAGLKDGEIPCSLDLVITYTVAGHKFAVVIDFKTGQQQYVSRVEDNPQLTFGALCVDRAMLATTKQVKLWFAGPHRVWEESYDVDPFMVPALESQIQALLKSVLNGQPMAKAGDHCQFCPALGACPVTNETMGQIAPGKFEWTTDIKSTAHAAFLADNIGMAEKSLDYIREALKRYCDSVGGIPLSNGQTWGPVDSSKTSLNSKAVKAKLSELGILDQFMQTVHVKSYRATGKKTA